MQQFSVGTYPPSLFVTVHVHLLLGRFMLMIIMSVATWMFPRPSRVRMPTVSAPARG